MLRPTARYVETPIDGVRPWRRVVCVERCQ